MQIQMHAAKDPAMAHKTGILMQAFQGKFPEDGPAESEQAEMCD